MKRLVLLGACVALLGAAAVSAEAPYAQAPQGQTPPAEGGHTAPKPQPATGPAVTPPEGQIALGSVTLGRRVKADGKDLPAGTYQVRLTAESASPDAKGASAGLERWVEFLQGGQVRGREVATIIPQSEIENVQKDAPPANNSSKVELLRGGDYLRVWIRRGGNHYLMHFPV
jgi:hypothetical protein